MKAKQKKTDNLILTAIAGGFLAGMFFPTAGMAGVITGAIIGGLVGNEIDNKDQR